MCHRSDQWASPKHHMKGLSWYNSMLISHKNQVKLENYCISRNGHRIKITQPNSMILVSLWASAEDALTSDVKKYDTFSSQGPENPPFRFFFFWGGGGGEDNPVYVEPQPLGSTLNNDWWIRSFTDVWVIFTARPRPVISIPWCTFCTITIFNWMCFFLFKMLHFPAFTTLTKY